MVVSSEAWTKQRNLSLTVEREAFLYLLGRVGRESLPSELWVFLALYPHMWNHRPTEFL